MKKIILKSVGIVREKVKSDDDVWEEIEMARSRKRTSKEKSYPLTALTSTTY